MKSFRNSVVGATAAALITALLFGSTGVLTWLAARAAVIPALSVLGAPFGLPGLRLVPFGEQVAATLVVSDLAAVLLVAGTGWWTARGAARRPAAGAVRVAARAWSGFILAAMAANALRSLWLATGMGFGPLGYGGYAAAGAASGALWALALGWFVALAAALAGSAPAVTGLRPRVSGP